MPFTGEIKRKTPPMTQAATPKRPTSPAWKGVYAGLITLVFGPPIGSILLFLAIASVKIFEDQFSLDSLTSLVAAPLLAIVTLPVAYAMTAPPALLCAALVGVWVARTGTLSNVGAVAAVVIGAAAIAVFGWILSANHAEATNAVQLAGAFLALATPTALLLRFISVRLGVVRP